MRDLIGRDCCPWKKHNDSGENREGSNDPRVLPPRNK
jgi:hypothetical protein